jgi:glycine/serine hydroxymethyltransferase
MKESEMKVVADFMHKAIQARADDAKLKKLKSDVRSFCKDFLFYK